MWFSVVEGEGGRQELSTDEEGRASEEEDGLLSSGLSNRGMPGLSVAISEAVMGESFWAWHMLLERLLIVPFVACGVVVCPPQCLGRVLAVPIR